MFLIITLLKNKQRTGVPPLAIETGRFQNTPGENRQLRDA